MTPDDFRAWRGRMAAARGTYSQADAAGDLGVRVLQVKRWERRPPQLGAGAPHPIPRAVALACAALEAGLAAE